MKDDSPVVKLTYLILLDGFKKGATEIHFEPPDPVPAVPSPLLTFRVLHRLEGVLQEAMRPPLQLRDALVARLKVMGQLDLLRQVPQEGGFRLRIGGRQEVDFGLTVSPTEAGERVVVRLPPNAAAASDPPRPN